MTLEVRKTAQSPPMLAAVNYPGIIYETEDKRQEPGCQWAAFFARSISAHITYREVGPWRVHVILAGFTKHSSTHPSYDKALTGLKEQLGKLYVSLPKERLLN